MHGLLAPPDFQGRDVLIPLLAKKLRKQFPETLRVPDLDLCLEITISTAHLIAGAIPGVKVIAQHLWLFELVGRLKGIMKDLHIESTEDPEAFSPLGLVFVDALESDGLLKEGRQRIQWSDADAVRLEFEEVWMKRLFPKGSPFLEQAVAEAIENPLIDESNRYFRIIVNTAYNLQTRQPGLPILLPVTQKLAALLDTTVVTLGTAISKAIREHYLIIENPNHNRKAGKARTFRFNMDHPKLKEALSPSDEKAEHEI